MALIVKSSIDILPWTEIEKQKLIEEKKEFLNKNENEVEKVEKVEEKKKEKKETKNSSENAKNTEKKQLKEDKKKEVNE